jgi:hypothetical protein
MMQLATISCAAQERSAADNASGDQARKAHEAMTKAL